MRRLDMSELKDYCFHDEGADHIQKLLTTALSESDPIPILYAMHAVGVNMLEALRTFIQREPDRFIETSMQQIVVPISQLYRYQRISGDTHSTIENDQKDGEIFNEHWQMDLPAVLTNWCDSHEASIDDFQRFYALIIALDVYCNDPSQLIPFISFTYAQCIQGKGDQANLVFRPDIDRFILSTHWKDYGFSPELVSCLETIDLYSYLDPAYMCDMTDACCSDEERIIKKRLAMAQGEPGMSVRCEPWVRAILACPELMEAIHTITDKNPPTAAVIYQEFQQQCVAHSVQFEGGLLDNHMLYDIFDFLITNQALLDPDGPSYVPIRKLIRSQQDSESSLSPDICRFTLDGCMDQQCSVLKGGMGAAEDLVATWVEKNGLFCWVQADLVRGRDRDSQLLSPGALATLFALSHLFPISTNSVTAMTVPDCEYANGMDRWDVPVALMGLLLTTQSYSPYPHRWILDAMRQELSPTYSDTTEESICETQEDNQTDLSQVPFCEQTTGQAVTSTLLSFFQNLMYGQETHDTSQKIPITNLYEPSL